MAFKGIGDWSELRVNGIWAWIHRLVMLITFPIRRFWQIMLIVAAVVVLLLIAHFYYGIGLEHISHWYNTTFSDEKIAEVKDKTLSGISERVGQVKNTVADAVNTGADDKTAAPAVKKKHFVAWNVPEFKKAKYKPTAGFTRVVVSRKTNNTSHFEKSHKNAEVEDDKVITETETAVTTPEVLVKEKQAEPLVERPKKLKKIKTLTQEDFYTGPLTDYYEVVGNRGLVYLDEPKTLYGAAEIVGPNSLYVDDTFLFLYGIYTDPQEYDYLAALRYAEKLTDGKTVRCEIVAYASQTQAATALCFTEEEFINKALVRHDLARNVAIK